MARGTRTSQRRRRFASVGRGRSPKSRPQEERRSPDRYTGLDRRFSLSGYVDTLAIATAVAGPLLLYMLTMPRTVALEDDGWFLIVGKFLGVGHPPGYPVHTMISNLFLKLPWGSPAQLGHLLSAIFGALACGAVYACARLLGAGVVAALIGTWLFAVSEHFWAQSIITEVYTLNALCFFGIFALLLYLRRTPGDARAWAAVAFLYGTSLANHWPLMALASPGLLLAVVPMWRGLLRRWWMLAGAFVLGVIPPYAWMVLHSLREPLFSFPGPLRTFEQVVAHLSRRAYADVDTSASAGLADKLQFLGWFAGDMVWQLTLPGFLLALLGLSVLLARPPWRLRGPDRIDDGLDWIGRLAGPVAFFGQSILLLWLLSFDFDFFHVQVLRPYPLVCYGLLGVWLALGMNHAMSLTADHLPGPVFRRPGMMMGVAASVGVMMVGWSTSAHWDANYRAGSDFAQRYADMVFAVLPPDALLMTSGDEITLPLAYYHFVEGRQPDMRLVEMHGIAFPSNLYPAEPRATREEQQEVLREFIADTERPVFHSYRTHRVDHGRTIRDYGFLREVRDEAADDTIQIRPVEAAEEYFSSLFEREYRNGWELVARNHQVIDYGQYLGFAFISGVPELMERTAPLRELAMQDYYGLNGMASVLAKFGNAEQLEQAMEWLVMAEPLRGDAITRRGEAEVYNSMGTVRWRQGRVDEAIAFYEKSRDIMPHPDNPGVKHLEQLTH